MDFLALVKEYWADIVYIFDKLYAMLKDAMLGE